MREWQGQIVRTAAEIDPQTRMITAVARVPDPFGLKQTKAPLPMGLFVTAEIEGITMKNIYRLPRAALRGENQVLVVDELNRLHFREVGLVRLETDQVLVNSGLSPGDRVCISLLETPVDGMAVRVADEGGSAASAAKGQEATSLPR